MDDLAALLDDARARLDGVPRVRLGRGREARRLARVFGGRPVVEPVASAWHLGVLLVGDEKLWATGDIVRAAEEVRRGYTAESQRVRASIRAMAFRGGFAEGEVCHIDWRELDVAAIARGGSADPLSWDAGRLLVAWSPAGFRTPLAAYLDERIRLAAGS
ncbi:glutaminase [Microbacterium excoecariae]|uniref:glutaminase n=1 Tax=Microbacterium excoecariae TaxID=2715210 RepID=UPI00140DC648|nr:glutaminase [Microbacterium excoecariae]NHI15621.1 glutaminase [Microbacterium excoecariae]